MRFKKRERVYKKVGKKFVRVDPNNKTLEVKECQTIQEKRNSTQKE